MPLLRTCGRFAYVLTIQHFNQLLWRSSTFAPERSTARHTTHDTCRTTTSQYQWSGIMLMVTDSSWKRVFGKYSSRACDVKTSPCTKMLQRKFSGKTSYRPESIRIGGTWTVWCNSPLHPHVGGQDLRLISCNHKRATPSSEPYPSCDTSRISRGTDESKMYHVVKLAQSIFVNDRKVNRLRTVQVRSAFIRGRTMTFRCMCCCTHPRTSESSHARQSLCAHGASVFQRYDF